VSACVSIAAKFPDQKWPVRRQICFCRAALAQKSRGRMQKRALIVDDERSNRELLERVLVAAGVEPTSVNNGVEALGTLQAPEG
jgi:PleD family two-component response regulator